MSNPERFDLVVLGSGEAGKYISWAMAKAGKTAIVVERKYVGGSCPNVACLPTKNFVHSAKVATYFRRAAEFGINVSGWELSMLGVRGRKRKMVNALIEINRGKYTASGSQLLMGEGKFIAPRTLQVATADGATHVLEGEKVVISTGSRATIPAIPGLAEAKPLTHVEYLELDTLPQHLIVLGGGYVGLELGQAMRRLGARVTIVEMMGRLAHLEDPDVSEAMLHLFQDEGIDVFTQTSVTRVEGESGGYVRVVATQDGREIVIEGSHILAATGRTPNNDGIGLELAGVEKTQSGHIKVNERLETTAPNVWAVGDCAGSPHFTHIAYDDYRIVRDNIMGGNRVTTGRFVPYCVFIDPEFARVGLSETEAKARGISYRLARMPMAGVLRAQTLSGTRGFMKALIDAKSDKILGFAGFGEGAGETLSVVQTAMTAGMPYTAIRDSIFIHPTLIEGLTFLFGVPVSEVNV